MTGCDVPEFMAHHPCKLGFIIEIGQNASCQVEIASGHGKGVDDRGIHDLQLVREIRPVRKPRQLMTHVIEISIQLLILIDTVFFSHLGVCLFSEFNFIRIAQEHELRSPAHRIRRTGTGQQEKHQNRSQNHSLDAFAFHFTSPLLLHHSWRGLGMFSSS